MIIKLEVLKNGMFVKKGVLCKKGMLSPENPILRVFYHYDHYETFTSLFYFWKTNILKKSLEFYLDFENLSFLTNFGFSRGVYRGSNLIFEQNKNYPQYQCISDHIFRGVLYKKCKNDYISPPPKWERVELLIFHANYL